jgi:translation elongation factor EF-Ts
MKPTIMQIKEVREITGLGLHEVVKAFKDVDKFEDIFGALQKRGVEISESRQHRTTGVRRLHTYLHHNGKYASIVGFSCETDFVANSLPFKTFMERVCRLVAVVSFEGKKDSIETLAEMPTLENTDITVADLVAEISAQVGEKVEIFGYTQKKV